MIDGTLVEPDKAYWEKEYFKFKLKQNSEKR